MLISNTKFQITASHLALHIIKIPLLGLTLTEKWNTEGILGTTAEFNNQFARGLKATLDTAYTPNTGKRDALLKTEWTNENVKVGNLLDELQPSNLVER